MSCKDKLGGTHHFACDCREAEFAEWKSRAEKAEADLEIAKADGANLAAACKALVARLEAAELVCSGLKAEHKACLVEDCIACRLEVWKKASGPE